MSSEPKSIFTSRKEFGSQSSTEKSLPSRIPIFSDVTTLNPPSPETSNIERETVLGATTQHGATSVAGRVSAIETTGVKRRAYSLPRRTLGVAAGDILHSKSIHHPLNGLPNEPTPSTPAKSSHASKHPRAEDTGQPPVSTEPSSKRNRPKLGPRHSLGSEGFRSAGPVQTVGLPLSPLFFSHSPRQRPIPPPSLESWKTAAIMPNKARDDPSQGFVTTLKLARGSISNASPPGSISTPGSWTSGDLNNLPRSPDSRNRFATGMQLLGSVGIVELLEQDERPTFIIDLANPLNFKPGVPLQIIFANASLRAYESLFEMVSGKADLDSPLTAVTNDFPVFKAWAISFVKNGESLDVCLPSFVYGGVTWSCSTLRKRLRLISTTVNVVSTGAGSTGSNGALSASSMDRIRAPSLTSLKPSPLAEPLEPLDYFGDTTQPLTSRISASPQQIPPNPTATEELGTPPMKVVLPSQGLPLTKELMQSRYPEGSYFDWTRLPVSAALPRHIQFARSIDWASTSLGPIENWSFDLRFMCNLIMGSPHPAAMYWGDEYIAIYNEAYILLAGQKHPQLMGQSYKTAWAEIWEDIEVVFSSAKESGQSTMKDDDCLFIRRNGFLEESYFSWSIIPLIGEDGSVLGLYNPAFEKTRRKIAERRMLTLREIGEMTAAARDVQEFWEQVLKGLEYNEYDVPFAFLYSAMDEYDSEMGSIHSAPLNQAPQCVLEGTLGVPEGHKAALSPLDLKTSEEGFTPYFREAMKTDKPILLTTEDGTLSQDLIEGLEGRGFGDPCRAAVVCPIHPTTGDTILGFLVMGVNPRRPYDDDYSLFIQLLSRQLATSMASVVLFEEEIKRGQRAARLAALDRQELSKQLDLRTQEAVESETRFTRMAEFTPVGMFIANSSGEITYSNDTWWEISRHPRTSNSLNSWMESIKDEDRKGVETVWNTLTNKKQAVTHEFRFKAPWEHRNGDKGDTWVLMNAYPERDENGDLKSVFGSFTNISQQKWVEDFQKRRMEEAIELKRQQENFIDMTSHEMRNPLSAILQCSDEITNALSACRVDEAEPKVIQNLNNVLESSIDAAQTIALCAQHQKRIVDDILTMSKLDSALLMVTPVAVQPVAVVNRALKMFEGELDTNDITMEFKMDKSYSEFGIDWVKLDPSRLLQVLINLTTNAIKFTQGQEKRAIIVSVGASKERPRPDESGVSYFPSRSNRKNLVTDELEWGNGEEVHLYFTVQDTGRGLDNREKSLLFQRFSQASPRTHVQYGGSGLGLFISRELTELQGGEIGVSSTRGVGSTFAFYIKARKVNDITEEIPITAAMNSLTRHSSTSAAASENRRHSYGKTMGRSNTTSNLGRRASGTIPKSPSPKASDFSPSHGQLKVLIVEDNLVNQKVLQKQLRNLGFMTELANHGGEALDFLKTTQFWSGRESDGTDLAIILMDLEMPVMDGLTCAKRIRELEADGTIVSHIPIIAVTANARPEQIDTAISSGMDDVVSKPFRMPELIPKIEELVQRKDWSASVSKPTTTDLTNLPA